MDAVGAGWGTDQTIGLWLDNNHVDMEYENISVLVNYLMAYNVTRPAGY